MKKSKVSEEQIATALRHVDAGAPVLEVTRKLGISEATFDVWKKWYGHLAVHEVRRVRQLEDEDAQLKRLVACGAWTSCMMRSPTDGRSAC
jgi:putative transposase